MHTFDLTKKKQALRITFSSNALCLQTPNCRSPIGTTEESRLPFINRRDLSHISWKTISSTESAHRLEVLLLASHTPVAQVQIKGFMQFEPETAFRVLWTTAHLSLPPKWSDTKSASNDTICILSIATPLCPSMERFIRLNWYTNCRARNNMESNSSSLPLDQQFNIITTFTATNLIWICLKSD